MYVVRRAFRNYNQMIAPGSVVEPGTIKRLKSRLRDGSIIEVSEQDFEKWDNYFKVRFGTSIQLPKAKAANATKPKEDTGAEPKVAATAKPAKSVATNVQKSN